MALSPMCAKRELVDVGEGTLTCKVALVVQQGLVEVVLVVAEAVSEADDAHPAAVSPVYRCFSPERRVRPRRREIARGGAGDTGNTALLFGVVKQSKDNGQTTKQPTEPTNGPTEAERATADNLRRGPKQQFQSTQHQFHKAHKEHSQTTTNQAAGNPPPSGSANTHTHTHKTNKHNNKQCCAAYFLEPTRTHGAVLEVCCCCCC